MFTSVSGSWATVICALDLSISLATLILAWTSYFWTGWTYANGEGTSRWKIVLAQISLLSVLYGMAGSTISSVNLIRQPSRQSLAVRLMFDLTMLPIKVVNAHNAYQTYARGTNKDDGDRAWVYGFQHWGENLAFPGKYLSPPEGRSRYPAEIVNQGSTEQTLGVMEAASAKTQRSLRDTLIIIAALLTYFIFGGISILTLVAASISFAKSEIGIRMMLETIWLPPGMASICVGGCRHCSRSISITHRNNQRHADLRRHLLWIKGWAMGTFVGALTWIVYFACVWNDRRAQIRDESNAKLQLVEAIFGVGG